MVPGGTAASSGKLRVGDRILKVNGTDVTQARHQEAVMELLRPEDNITLTVRHDPLPEGYQVEKSFYFRYFFFVMFLLNVLIFFTILNFYCI